MDPQRTRIQEDLRGLIVGDVRCDEVFTQLYASDASVYQIAPLGVVAPNSTADVVACVQYARENNLPIHARGAGTGLAGESLGPGLVLDFSRRMRRVLYTGEDTVRVQPGVVHERLNAHLSKYGKHFGPDPATSQVTTMGGVISVDSGGSHWLRYGSARRHVKSLQVVLSDGEVMELGRESLAASGGNGVRSRKAELLGRLGELLTAQTDAIAQSQTQSAVNRCGYQLADVLDDGSIDVAKLLAGSEGTLALITEATVATQPAPPRRAVALLFFQSLDRAARAALEAVALGPSACDLLDRRHLSLARETEPRFASLIPPNAEAMLLVEQSGDDAAEVRESLQGIVDRLRRKKRLAFDSRQAYDEEDVQLFWRLALRVVPTLYRLRGSTRPLPFVEDMSVPPGELPRFLVDLQNVLKRHQVVASTFAHVGQGQLHVRPFLDLADPRDVGRMHALAEDLYEAVWNIGGAISGEHGVGLSRTAFVRRQAGPLYDVFKQVKAIFDPWNVLNPGKIVADDPGSIARDLRPVAPAPEPAFDSGGEDRPTPGEVFPLQLTWTREEIAREARACNGCGACRSQSEDGRMCPIFRFAPAEEASPRAKANLLRGVLTGRLDPAAVASDEFKQVADLCVNCKMCKLECPAEVDIPRLMIEAKAAHVRNVGLSFGDRVLTRLDGIGRFGVRFRRLVNWSLANRPARWLIEKTLGIAQGRKLPRFERRSFLRQAARRRLTRPTRRSGRKVVYFVDNYVNYCDHQLGQAFVAVMEHNGVAVYVPPDQRQSAMSMIALGALDAARKIAEKNVTLLAEAVRQGYDIVATEPSAALCLKSEYLALLDDDDARLVAEHSSEACDYLWRMHLAGGLQLDFKPVNASLAYHQPCHSRALATHDAACHLLRLVPGLDVRRLEEGCSGMAGSFGLRRENYRSSLRAGWNLISALRQTELQAGVTECSACKMQMEQGSTKPTLHPLKLLALAYGLLPEAAELLTAQGEELIVT